MKGSAGNAETANWRDTGCGGACIRSLECPFPRCVHDERALGVMSGRPQRRAMQIVAAFEERHETAQELAARFGVSTRTVQRILQVVRRLP